MPTLSLTLLPDTYSVCRLAPGDPVPAPSANPFSWVVAAPDEITFVCPGHQAPQDAQVDPGWSCLRIDQSFTFDVPGVLASVLQPLALAGIGIFATSTFSTDYVLVKAEKLEGAIAALRAAGHRIGAV
ncbi:MAG TPA: ACT domain-containing protein [Microvirga sp.]|jgi:hypothetical protein